MSYEPPPAPRAASSDADLTPVDWVLCALCSGIGCIVGIVRMIQGKPSGVKMVGISIAFIIFWTIIRLVIEAATRR